MEGSHSLAWWYRRGVLDPPPRLSLPALAVMAGLGVLTVVVSATEFGFILPGIVIAVWYVVWSFRTPLVAVTTIILLSLYIIDRSEGISAIELCFSVYAFGYIGYWFFDTAFVKRERILRAGPDRFLIAFLFLCLASVIIILAEHGSVFLWLRECITAANLLLYFPAREAMRKRRNRAVIMSVFLLMVTVIAVTNLNNYRSSSLAAVYLFEVVGSRAAFGSHYFVAVLVIAVSLYAHMSGRASRWACVGAALIAGAALTVTFSRAFWIGALAAFALLFLMMDRPGRRSLTVTLTLMCALVFGFVMSFVGSMARSVMEALVTRFASSGTPLEDISVTNRIAESGDVIASILAEPLLGHGMGGTFKNYNIILKMTVDAFYVHNAFLLLLLKVGIIGMVIFFGFYLGIIRRGIQLSRQGQLAPFDLGCVRGVVAVLTVFLLIGLSSGIWVNKEALLVIALGSALIMATGESGQEGG